MPLSNPRASELFHKASTLESPGERRALLDLECQADAALRQEVEALLAAGANHEANSSGQPAAGPPSGETGGGHAPNAFESPQRERPGVQIGRYTLRELIGEGGMGAVWIAEQFKPVRRRVALKLVKAGMDSKQVVSRFEVERQALALMDHPNIAKVHDGGVTDTGRPYFVMEYVRGIPITQYCDDARLTVKERLKLFVQVCQAVQHAHQKGIIHRDLKPSNILVCLYDGQPVPKVIDFGLAKAMHQPLTENTLYTAHGMMVGTPLYMSPEQAEFNNLDVDTRTDVYSLGVILYELLTGTTPLERKRFKDAAWQEVLRIIKEEEPQKPSTKISGSGSLPSIAAQRSLEPAQLSRVMRGDLDWIVMKTLEKERSRRYETASGLARDVQRYLDDEPVEACPPSLGYKLRKLARRNKKALATAGILSVVILGALAIVAGSIGWAVRDRQNRQAVVERQASARLEEASAAFKQDRISIALAAVKQAEGLLATSETRSELAQAVRDWKADLTMVERLAEVQFDRSVDDDDAAGRAMTAAAYQKAFEDYDLNLIEMDRNLAVERIRESRIKLHLLAALDDWSLHQAQAESGTNDRGDDRRKLVSIARLADSDSWRTRLRDAVERNDPAELKRLAQAPDAMRQLPVLVAVLAAKLRQMAEFELTVQLLRDALTRNPSDFGIRQSLGITLLASGSGDALRYLHPCATERPKNASVRTALGLALYDNDYVEEAIEELGEAIRLRPDYAEPHIHLGESLRYQEKFPEAEAEFRKAMQLNPQLFAPVEALSGLLLGRGDLAKAEKTFREAVEKNPHSAPAYVGLGEVLIRQKKWSEAEQAWREAVRLDPSKPSNYGGLAGALEGQQKPAEAEAALMKWVTQSPNDDNAHLRLAEFLRGQSRWAEAAEAYEEANRDSGTFKELAQLSSRLSESPDDMLLLLRLGVTLADTRKSVDQATTELARAVKLPELDVKQLTPDKQLEHGGLWLKAGMFLCSHNRPDNAAIALRRSLALLENWQRSNAHDSANLNRLATADVYLGSSLWSHDNARETIDCDERAFTLDSKAAVDAHLVLGKRYLSQGRWDEGARHLAIVVAARPQDHLLAMQTAVAQLHNGDRDGYVRVCEQMLAMFGDSQNPLDAYRTVKACLLSETPVGKLEHLAKLAETATADPKHGLYRIFILVRALSAYRNKDWEQALEWCKRGHDAIDQSSGVPHTAHYFVVQSMAQHRLGKLERAKSSLLEANKFMSEYFPAASENRGNSWADWALYEVLRREAETLIMPAGEPANGGVP